MSVWWNEKTLYYSRMICTVIQFERKYALVFCAKAPTITILHYNPYAVFPLSHHAILLIYFKHVWLYVFPNVDFVQYVIHIRSKRETKYQNANRSFTRNFYYVFVETLTLGIAWRTFWETSWAKLRIKLSYMFLLPLIYSNDILKSRSFCLIPVHIILFTMIICEPHIRTSTVKERLFPLNSVKTQILTGRTVPLHFPSDYFWI